jgi:xanthine dehydrogenase molybdopterin-binding subunit B
MLPNIPQVKQAVVAALSQLLPAHQRPLPLSLVRIAPSSSDVVPNGGPTWASTGSEANCAAVIQAAGNLVQQLAPHLKVGPSSVFINDVCSCLWQGGWAVQLMV